MNLRTAVLAILLTVSAVPALAANDECPGATNNDDCDRIMFQNADAELARAIEGKLDDIGRRSIYTGRVEEAKSSLAAAHREWLLFREAECRAQAAIGYLISARTREGLMASCLHRLTSQRIEELGQF